MNEDQISNLLSDLAGIDTHDINLRNHPAAYAAVEAAIAPLLQDLAAHEASNRIKTENLETLREQNGKLREAFKVLASEAKKVVDDDYLPPHQSLQKALKSARAALGESDE